MSDNNGDDSGTDYVEINGLYKGAWPDDWTEDDIEFVAKLLFEQLNVRISKEYTSEDGFERPIWALEVPAPLEDHYVGGLDDE